MSSKRKRESDGTGHQQHRSSNALPAADQHKLSHAAGAEVNTSAKRRSQAEIGLSGEAAQATAAAPAHAR